MSEPYIGEIHMFGGNFPPVGYAFCNGTPLPIAQYDALFALIGTTYGGDGQTTFNLPDLRGRIPVHQGQGRGLPPVALGQSAGSETVTLIGQQLPVHNHPASASTQGATTTNPQGALLAATTTNNELYAAPGAGPAVKLAPQSVAPAGGNQPHDNLMPFLAINFIIALEGLFPPRN